MLPKTKNKKNAICLTIFLAGVQTPFAKLLVHNFAEQSKNSYD